jgi:hypothetical protein
MKTIIIINVISVVATVLSIYGSKLCVKGNYGKANKVFVLGNSMNIAVALSCGNIAFLLGQYMLRYYTINMIEDKMFKNIAGLLVLTILAVIGINTNILNIDFNIFELIGTIGAILGTKRMIKGDIKNMSYWWIIADLVFFYVGIDYMIGGLIVASLMFTLHGVQRLRVEKATNMFDKVMMLKLF